MTYYNFGNHMSRHIFSNHLWTRETNSMYWYIYLRWDLAFIGMEYPFNSDVSHKEWDNTCLWQMDVYYVKYILETLTYLYTYIHWLFFDNRIISLQTHSDIHSF